MNIEQTLKDEFKLRTDQVDSVLGLIDEGKTIPFIARYRKEQTGGMSDETLRDFFERLKYLRNLEARKEAILKAIEEQEKLTEDIALAIEKASTMVEIEDIYEPFKKKRKTRASAAIEKGLEPLANILLFGEEDVRDKAEDYINEEMGVNSAEEAVEGAMDIQVPRRAEYLRTIWHELSRMHSHLLWLGLFADALGFESLFMQFWKIRERIMDINEATAGNRVIISTNIVGGVRKDLSREHQRWILDEMDTLEAEMRRLEKVTMEDYTVKKRTVGIGVMTAQEAIQLGAAGPTLRGSGVAQDVRQTEYEAFAELGFTPVSVLDGDCWARTKVRFLEVLQSMEIVRQAISHLPDTEINVKVKGNPSGEVISRVEQPRGECMYYVKGNGSKYLDRVRIRTPTFANIPPLLHMVKGIQLADVPVVVLSIDPCISCTER